MFDIRFLVKYLDEVEVAVVGFIETVLWELDVDLLSLLGSDDPGAVERCSPLPGVGHLLSRDVRCSWETTDEAAAQYRASLVGDKKCRGWAGCYFE